MGARPGDVSAATMDSRRADICAAERVLTTTDPIRRRGGPALSCASRPHPAGFPRRAARRASSLIRSAPRVLAGAIRAVSYTHLRAHETDSYLVCRLLLEKKK